MLVSSSLSSSLLWAIRPLCSVRVLAGCAVVFGIGSGKGDVALLGESGSEAVMMGVSRVTLFVVWAKVLSSDLVVSLRLDILYGEMVWGVGIHVFYCYRTGLKFGFVFVYWYGAKLAECE